MEHISRRLQIYAEPTDRAFFVPVGSLCTPSLRKHTLCCAVIHYKRDLQEGNYRFLRGKKIKNKKIALKWK